MRETRKQAQRNGVELVERRLDGTIVDSDSRRETGTGKGFEE